MWKIDKDGVILNEPEHQFKHSMDAISYAMTHLLSPKQVAQVKVIRPQWSGFNRR
jgi:phage terminase large subunit